MTTDLENRIREALASRGNAITPATLRTPAPSFPHADENRPKFDPGRAPQLVSIGAAERRQSGRRTTTWLSVAAVVTLFATTVALAVRSNDQSPRPSAAGSSLDSISLLRTLHFAIDLPAGYQLARVSTSADGTQDVEISAKGNRNIQMSVDPTRGADRHFASDARAITVAGRPGFVGSTWTDSAANGKTLDTSISWKYNAAAYAIFVNPKVDRAELLALARRIDFSKKTPVRVATSFPKLTAGTSLADVNSTYRDGAQNAGHPWESSISLDLDSSPRDGITIALCKCASSDSARHSAQTLTVNGKTAYIYPNGEGGADVEIDEGNGVTLHVSSSHNDGGRWTGTTNTLLELARSISVTPHPSQPAKWFDAATALP